MTKDVKEVIKSSSDECGTCNIVFMCLVTSCMLHAPGPSKEVIKFGWNKNAVHFEGSVVTCSL